MGHYYMQSGEKFGKFADLGERKPTEADFLQYFDNLYRPPKNMKASSIWSIYSSVELQGCNSLV